uniref:NIF3-like protein 1 n=1 Tax=Xiphophorus couchianus TaxID=32473 RepID=A0A3B5L2W8_9TELE
MLPGWRNLSWTFYFLKSRRLLICKSSNFNTSALFPSASSGTQTRLTSGLLLRSSVHSPSVRRLSVSAGPMELKEVLQVLEQLAPLSLAELWDNVGLLVEPSKSRPIKTVLLTNDLTDGVMEEAEALSCDLIVSYHPPLFRVGFSKLHLLLILELVWYETSKGKELKNKHVIPPILSCETLRLKKLS